MLQYCPTTKSEDATNPVAPSTQPASVAPSHLLIPPKAVRDADGDQEYFDAESEQPWSKEIIKPGKYCSAFSSGTTPPPSLHDSHRTATIPPSSHSDLYPRHVTGYLTGDWQSRCSEVPKKSLRSRSSHFASKFRRSENKKEPDFVSNLHSQPPDIGSGYYSNYWENKSYRSQCYESTHRSFFGGKARNMLRDADEAILTACTEADEYNWKKSPDASMLANPVEAQSRRMEYLRQNPVYRASSKSHLST